MNIHPRIWQPVLKSLLGEKKGKQEVNLVTNYGSHNKTMIQSGDGNNITIQNFYGCAGVGGVS